MLEEKNIKSILEQKWFWVAVIVVVALGMYIYLNVQIRVLTIRMDSLEATVNKLLGVRGIVIPPRGPVQKPITPEGGTVPTEESTITPGGELVAPETESSAEAE